MEYIERCMRKVFRCLHISKKKNSIYFILYRKVVLEDTLFVFFILMKGFILFLENFYHRFFIYFLQDFTEFIHICR